MRLLTISLLLLLSSCSLFTSTPAPVLEAQRQAYAGLAQYEKINQVKMGEFEFKLKSMITYIHNYAYSVDVRNVTSEEEREQLEEKTNSHIATDHAKVDAMLARWKAVDQRAIDDIQTLIEAVYNYMSTTPLTVENLSSLAETSKNTWGQLNERAHNEN